LKYLVTGGAGFIGSNLSEYLIIKGKTQIIDDLSTGTLENIKQFKDKINFTEISILDYENLLKLTKGVDYIFHQAALPSVPRSIKNPVATNNVNINGTLNILEAARRNDVKKVIYASSSSVYGDTPILPKQETMKPNPLSPYAVSKLTGEYYCRVYSKVYNIPTVCLRYFNVYGPRQNPYSEYSAVIPKFITAILKQKPPTIYGNGYHTRDFTYVKDVVQANYKAAISKNEGIYNIGYGEQTSLTTLANKIMEITGTEVDTKYEPERPGDVKDSLADITEAKAKINYRPEYDITRGLEETIDWYRKHMINQ
jgi:nucleoside-diphosphate-sugar epimerase